MSTTLYYGDLRYLQSAIESQEIELLNEIIKKKNNGWSLTKSEEI